MLYAEKQLIHFANYVLAHNGIDTDRRDVSHAVIENYKNEGHDMPFEPGEFAVLRLWDGGPQFTVEVVKTHVLKNGYCYDFDVSFEPGRILRMYNVPPGWLSAN